MTTTFHVEDGSGVYNATSYVSLADADAYFGTLNSINPVTNGPYATAWTSLTTDQKEQALNQATYAVDLLYGQDFLSMPQYPAPPQPGANVLTQNLLWPRYTMIVNRIQVVQASTIPYKLKYAVCDVAMMYVNGINIFPAPNTRKTLKSETQKVGDLMVSNTYGLSPPVEKFTNFWKIEKWLEPYLRKTSMPSYLSL